VGAAAGAGSFLVIFLAVETLFSGSQPLKEELRSDFHHFRGLQSFGAFIDGELNCLTLVERLVALFLNRAVVDEYVGSRIGLDESIALLIVKPLHYTLFFHAFLFSFVENVDLRVSPFLRAPATA
jgi:hypothetical protein